MEHLLRDLRTSVRSLSRTPGFVAVAALTLALGIGANAAIFSVVDAVLLRPLAYAGPKRLVAIFEEVGSEARNPTSPANFLDWQEAGTSFGDMTAAHPWAPVLRGEGRPEELQGLKASPSLFRLLGVAPLYGRAFDGTEAGERVVVLGHGLFQRRFGGDPTVVGRTLDLDGEPHTVVAVMPPGFEFPPFWATGAELWAPLELDPETGSRRQARFLRVFARLRPGVTLEGARAEMDAVAARLADEHPDSHAGVGARVEPLLEPVVGDVRTALLALFATVGGVLLVACANVANLTLVRTAARHRELALRQALGAGKVRLLSLVLTEGLVVALGGASLGLVLALAGLRALPSLAGAELPRFDEVRLDPRAFLFTLAITFLVGVLCSVAPAWRSTRLGLAETLRDAGRVTSPRRRLGEALVVAEVALALVLLLGAGLVGRSLWALWRLDPGFDPSEVETVTISLAGTRYAEPRAQGPFLENLVAEVETLPGVERAALVNHLPIGGDLWRMSFTVEGLPASGGDEELPKASFRVVSPRYFDALGVPLRAGRAFTAADREGSRPVVLVNETLAERFFPDRGAVGGRLRQGREGDDWLAIVGVVSDVKQSQLSAAVTPEIYFPYRQNPVGFYKHTTLVVRSKLDVLAAVERHIAELAPEVPASGAATMSDVLTSSLGPRRFHTVLLAAFAGLSLVLASVGIYGVLSHAVGDRRQEIGVRMALGAPRRRIFVLVVGRGMALVSVGVALGLAGAAVLTRLVESLLYEVSALDPWTFVLVPSILAVVAFLAAFLPGRRATRVDPAVSLRV